MEKYYGSEALSRMDAAWEQGQALVKNFRNNLEPKSHTARSIDRGDCWSETASWARRDGYNSFATELDLCTFRFNDLVPLDFRA